jgi:glycosyltransferase involved in cell wall biosynthesis
MHRVLTVIPGPTFGGAANQVLQLAEPLRAHGWELVAVLPDEPGNAAARLDGAVELHRVPMRRLRNTSSPAPHLALARHALGDVRRLRELVRSTGASVVQNHGDLNPQAGIAGHLEGAAVHWQLLDTRTPVLVRRLTMPLVTRLADSITTVGDELARVNPGALSLAERCITVYPPHDHDRFRASGQLREQARAELGVPAGAICIGAIGNRNPQKGHDSLIRAAARVRDAHPGVVVRVLGAPSPGHEDYERSLHETAEQLGLTNAREAFAAVDPADRVSELIGALDVMCMSSVPSSEGMPTVIFEAMAAGIPVVATDVGAVREIFGASGTGLLVPASDDDALAGALLRLVEDAALRERIGAAGQARAGEFSLERLTGLYARAYELALEHRRGRRRRGAATRTP